MTFHEDWFDASSQQRIADLATTAPADGILVEIGAWEGRSTVAIANAVNPRILHTVDTWAGASSDVTGQLAAERDVYATWRGNVRVLTAGNVIGHRANWRDFIPRLEVPVAFCFIDAEHTYDEVADNIAAILPHLTPGAILCGDDYACEEVQRACADTLGTVEHDTVWWRTAP